MPYTILIMWRTKTLSWPDVEGIARSRRPGRVLLQTSAAAMAKDVHYADAQAVSFYFPWHRIICRSDERRRKRARLSFCP